MKHTHTHTPIKIQGISITRDLTVTQVAAMTRTGGYDHTQAQIHKLSSKQPDGPSELPETMPWLFRECLRTGHWHYPTSPQEVGVDNVSLDLLRAQNGPFWGAGTKGGTIAHQLTLSRTIMTYESACPPTHGLKHLLLAGITRVLFINIQASLLLRANLSAAISFPPNTAFMSRWSEKSESAFQNTPSTATNLPSCMHNSFRSIFNKFFRASLEKKRLPAVLGGCIFSQTWQYRCPSLTLED